jgi:hypothetical protein
VNTNEKIKKRKEEIQGIYELLQACLEEEGYVIPFAKYSDERYKAFDLPLRNPLYKDGETILIKIEWS